jgi:hypothetical protein
MSGSGIRFIFLYYSRHYVIRVNQTVKSVISFDCVLMCALSLHFSVGVSHWNSVIIFDCSTEVLKS